MFEDQLIIGGATRAASGKATCDGATRSAARLLRAPLLQLWQWQNEAQRTCRFCGKSAINEFTDLRWITIQTSHRHYPV